MSSSIASQLMLDSADVYYRLTDLHYLDSLGYSPETAFCMIIPNTYEVWWNISPDALFRRLIQETEKFWNDSRKEKAANMGMTINQVMTLASIVEEETSQSEELPVVAGLYINRLKRGMPLQADPTVIFALGGERPKRVLNTHLEIDSPYNTYRITGLPPAPIRFVNIRSIDAVLNYSQHNYYYMCAKEDFSGYHNFAVTLSQHNLNAARYRNALNKAGVK
ncbi:MAG: putative aminodeoxychorismate lyase [Bacteroidetes bacterium ADurb.BinA104]|nr:MAG: putative aminodeoxychorismate lyase [Bacteroidetes bacterium ADurb.BinA104]